MFTQLLLLNGGNSLYSPVSCIPLEYKEGVHITLPSCRIRGRDVGFWGNSASDGRKPIAVSTGGERGFSLHSENCLPGSCLGSSEPIPDGPGYGLGTVASLELKPKTAATNT